MLQLDALTIRAGTKELVTGLSLGLQPGELVCLIGPSGCGKSSVARWLAGILATELQASGSLTLDGQPIRSPDPAIAYQPQEDALFPWLTVGENCALGLEIAGVTRRTAMARVLPLLDRFGLAGTERQFPRQLSGGMRQRAAFLRTMVTDCRYLILDEPFSALDAVTRLRMQDWLITRLAETPRATLLITHDLNEASLLADRILVMAGRPGRIHAEIAVPGRRGDRPEAQLADLRTTLKSLLLED